MAACVDDAPIYLFAFGGFVAGLGFAGLILLLIPPPKD